MIMSVDSYFYILLILFLDWGGKRIRVAGKVCSSCDGSLCRLGRLKEAYDDNGPRESYDFYCKNKNTFLVKSCDNAKDDQPINDDCGPDCQHDGRWMPEIKRCKCQTPFRGRLCEDSSLTEKFRYHRLSMNPTTFWLLVLLLPAGAGALLCLTIVVVCRFRNTRARQRAASVTSVRFQRVIGNQRDEAALSRFGQIDAQAMLQNRAIKEILCAEDQ